MSHLRRYPVDGRPVFVTAVTYDRLPLLRAYHDILIETFQDMCERKSFGVTAWVILPDHFHAILDLRKNSLASVMQSLKQSFSMKYRSSTGATGRVWQLRYWDHVIRVDEDMKSHLDYIHYNPVKHGLTDDAESYLESSYRDFRAQGLYPDGWGITDPQVKGSFGE